MKLENPPGMRACSIDGVAVVCPNASHLGYDKGNKARVGDTLTLRNDSGAYGSGIARVLGRVAYAAPFQSRDDSGNPVTVPAVRGHILGLCLSTCGSHAYIRWIDPEDVLQVRDAPSAMAAFFFAPSLPHSPDMILRLAKHGTLSDQFVSEHVARVAMFRERDATARTVAHATTPECGKDCAH
jgi:hypothetical protein